MLPIAQRTSDNTRSDNPFIADGCAAIKRHFDKFSRHHVGYARKISDGKFIDARGGLIMPGFISSHMHFYSTFSRGMNVPGRTGAGLLRRAGKALVAARQRRLRCVTVITAPSLLSLRQ